MVIKDLTTAISLVSASALLIRLFYSWLLPKPIPNIPHNPITSILGDIPAIIRFTRDGKGLFTEFVAHNTSIHGPISQILLGWHHAVIVTDRAEADRITLSGKIVDASARLRAIFATVLPNSQISFPADERWKKHRRLAGPSMSRRFLERMSSRIAVGASELVELWEAKRALVGGSAFKVDLDFHLATMDSIVNVALGEPIGCIKSVHSTLPSNHAQSASIGIAHLPCSEPPPLYTAGNVIMKGFERALQSPFPKLTTWLFVYTSPTWWRNYNLMTTFFTNAIAHARERAIVSENTGQGLSTNADCVLDMIVQRERQGAEALGDKDIHDELTTYVFAGHDTTASALSWLVKYLSLDPEIQHRLHKEIRVAFAGNAESNEPPDFKVLDDPERVPILEAVVAETMRCAGVGAFASRELLRDEVILGRIVPKGTQLLFTTDLMSKDESEWGLDAKEWRPNRWLTSDGAFNRSAGPSIPFGVGQRSCFGQRLAILQLKIYLATMSRAFFFKPVPSEVGTLEAVELMIRRPKLCYVSLEGWDLKNDC